MTETDVEIYKLIYRLTGRRRMETNDWFLGKEKSVKLGSSLSDHWGNISHGVDTTFYPTCNLSKGLETGEEEMESEQVKLLEDWSEVGRPTSTEAYDWLNENCSPDLVFRAHQELFRLKHILNTDDSVIKIIKEIIAPVKNLVTEWDASPELDIMEFIRNNEEMNRAEKVCSVVSIALDNVGPRDALTAIDLRREL